jgi:hypothetical protein
MINMSEACWIIIAWNFELKIIIDRAFEHDALRTYVSMNDLVFMQMAQNLKNLFYNFWAIILINTSSDWYYFIFEISSFEIFLNNVIVSLWL